MQLITDAIEIILFQFQFHITNVWKLEIPYIFKSANMLEG